MTDKEKETEEKIFEAASRVFQQKGYAGARMQEIADEAEINKSMLHYYYRSKNKLFQQVYQHHMRRFFPVVFEVMNSDMPLDEKIEQLVDAYYSFFSENPRLIQFIVHEMNQNPERFKNFISDQNISKSQKFREQVEHEIDQGHMDDVAAEQLLVSIVALTQFPFIVQPMIQSIFKMDESRFLDFLKERKAFLVQFILNGINYNES